MLTNPFINYLKTQLPTLIYYSDVIPPKQSQKFVLVSDSGAKNDETNPRKDAIVTILINSTTNLDAKTTAYTIFELLKQSNDLDIDTNIVLASVRCDEPIKLGAIDNAQYQYILNVNIVWSP